MTDKKFTDEEIKSSLEVIATTRNCNECKIRNCKWGTCNCSQITANVALDLINRQQAEIERLKSVQLVQANRIAELRGTKFEQINVIQNLKQQLITSKSEAVKEFAERLKKVWFDNGYESPDVDFEDFVDNLVKEMTGDTE